MVQVVLKHVTAQETNVTSLLGNVRTMLNVKKAGLAPSVRVS